MKHLETGFKEIRDKPIIEADYFEANYSKRSAD